jgi:hypothetical protein
MMALRVLPFAYLGTPAGSLSATTMRCCCKPPGVVTRLSRRSVCKLKRSGPSKADPAEWVRPVHTRKFVITRDELPDWRKTE